MIKYRVTGWKFRSVNNFEYVTVVSILIVVFIQNDNLEYLLSVYTLISPSLKYERCVYLHLFVPRWF